MEKANRPPGRSTRAASATASAMSATNCSAPKEQKTTSNDASANGSCVAVPSTEGTTTPVASSIRRECWSWRIERSSPTGRPPWAPTQREHCPAPEPTSSTSLPGDVAEHAELGLGVALGAPHEADVAEELAVRRLVLVGVAVPVGAVGPPRLGLGDRAPIDAYAGVDGTGRRSSGDLCRIRATGRSPGERTPVGPTLRHARRLRRLRQVSVGSRTERNTARYRVCPARLLARASVGAAPR